MRYSQAMSTAAARRADYVGALPTFAEAAALIMIDPSGVSRAVKALGIEPIPWGNREKHLAIADVFRIAIHAKRAALEEVGGGLLEWSEREHPDQVDAIRGEIDAFFASLPERKPADPDDLIASLRAGLPPEAAEQAIEIYLALLASKTK
ncbi:MAG: hypothetical protein ACLPZR_26945 [Solirubrobacteraceae bacterium]